ncbi:class I adenylate-forming enzyme family protein [Brevibacterium oceani]|uniref:class I adenylate-forming enzyme family protein n=1 Tax=Brevibacterium oceani TaxID=358099 RepID=UPI001B3219F3|nr:class I adenylate-forming enzyme family protein [Brevibacterium oceani]
MSNPTTFNDHWNAAVSAHGDRMFLVFRRDGYTDASFTYAQFDAVADAVAATLSHHGVSSGTGVHMCLRNCPAFIAVWLAAARLGAWIIPVDPSSSPRDLKRQTARTQPVVGIVGSQREEDYRASVDAGMAIITVAETAEDVLLGGPLRMVDAITAEGSASSESVLSPDDRLAVMFTSGTTSEPKGVILTQANYAYIAETMSSLAGVRPEHRWFVTLPLFHGNAQYYCFSAAIASGASVAMTHGFSASRWIDQARELEVTHASLFAAPIRMILSRTDPAQPPLSLTHVWYAQNLSEGHYQRFEQLCGTGPRQLYGMTETTAIVSCDLSDRPCHDTIGHPIEGRRIAVVSPLTGDRARTGEPGVLLLAGTRGADLFEGYLDDPSANDKAFIDFDGQTWFSTGDLVSVDDDGALSFVGRVDDVIKVSGENVSLTEVEASLAEAPGVLEVAVIAAPDEVRDTVPVAFVVAEDDANRPTIDALKIFASENLPKAARPQKWEIVESLPKTSVGKIRRFQLDATTTEASANS